VSEQPPAKPRRKRAGASVQVARTSRRAPAANASTSKKTTARKRTTKAAKAKAGAAH